MPTTDTSVRHKISLLHLAEELNNVSKACETLGYSRDSYYRFKTLYERGGADALRNLSRRKPVVKNRVSPDVENAVVEIAFAHPAWGQERTAEELKRRGVSVSSSGVRSIWQRYDLETMTKRGVAIAVRAWREGLPLSDEQQTAITRLRRQGKVTPARLKKGHHAQAPGEVCYQDHVHIGDHPELGPLYQHVVVDAYSRYAFARVECESRGRSPTAFLMSAVLPWFAALGLPIETLRTDRRPPFSGSEGAGYRTALERAGIDLTHRLVKSGDGEDPCAAFLKTARTSFYQGLFRAGLDEDMATLNARLGSWLKGYNEDRIETAASCYGHPPARVVASYLRAHRSTSGGTCNGQSSG